VERSASFAPVADASARILILGSLPGQRSLACGQYYAHPQNAFWRLVGSVVGVDLAAQPYGARLAALRRAGIALSDVIATATRRGSLDAEIRDVEVADLQALVAALPDLRAVAFNGATAAKIGRRRLLGATVTLLDLPSSSPAYAAMSFEAKLARWSAIAAFLPG
jgi:double-stranded uracil-DNA glycosylase